MVLPTTASLAITYRCNARCVMCDIWKKEEKRELPPKVYKKLPKTLKDIDITGGEPFLRDDLSEIVKILKEICPKARVLIITNGLLPRKTARVISSLLAWDKNLGFRVSLDGIGETHNQSRGVPGAFQKAIQTINVLKEFKIKDLGVIFTLMKINKDELPKILDFCQKEKLQFSLNLVHESPIYFGKDHLSLRPNFRETKKALNLVRKFFLPSLHPKNWAKAFFYQKLIDYAKTGKRPIRCGAGENFFYLDPLGNIYICHFKNWKIGNLKKQSFEEIWSKELRKKYLKRAKNCHNCFMICTAKDKIKKRKFSILREVLF